MTINYDVKKLLGKKIKELRVNRGYTQEYLAEQIGIGQRNLSKIECGNNFLTAKTLTKMLIVLNVDAQELFNFNYYNDEASLKEELLSAISNEKVNIKLLYKLYKAILN